MMLAEGPQSVYKTVALDYCQHTTMCCYVSGTYRNPQAMCSGARLTRTSKLSKSWNWWLSKLDFRIFWRWLVSAQGVHFTRRWEKLQLLNLILACNNITVSFPFFLSALVPATEVRDPNELVSEIGEHEKPQGNHMESLVFHPESGNPTIHIHYLVFDTASLWKNVVMPCTV